MSSLAHIQSQIRRSRGKRRLIKPPRPIPPLSLERKYRKALITMQKYLKSLVEELLVPKLAHYRSQAPKYFVGVKNDDLMSDIFGDFEKIRVIFGQTYTDKTLMNMAMDIALGVSDLNKSNIQNQFKSVLGIDLFLSDTKLEDVLSGFASNNARLIRTVPDKYLNDVSQTVMNGFSDGLRWEEVADDIAERYGVSEWNAERIARDQVSKLNGQLTEERQTEVGVTTYIWRGAMDERERESHVAHEGKEYDWDDAPASTGHPGEEILCRCYAEPKLDDLI